MDIVAPEPEANALEPLDLTLLRREADQYVRQDLPMRVFVLETQMKASNDRLSSIESEVRGMKDGISDLVRALHAHMLEEKEQKNQLLLWIVLTLVSVVGFGCAFLFDYVLTH